MGYVGQTATRVDESVMYNEEDALLDAEMSKMSTKRKNPGGKSNSEQVAKVSKLILMSCSSQSDDAMNTQESENDGRCTNGCGD